MIRKIVCNIFLSSCLASFGQPSKFKDKKGVPNIIVFLVDDMGIMDTSVPFICDENGTPVKHELNHFYRTPNMEILAQQGVRFSRFYAHSVCSPTRVSILTGQNSARHRVTNWILPEEKNSGEYGPLDWNWKGLDKNAITLPRIFQQNGYATIHVGKAHFGPRGSDGENPLLLGFDINIAGSSIGHPASYYGTDGFGHLNGRKKRAVDGLKMYHGKEIFLTEALTLEAKKAITAAHDKNTPFFLYMAHYAVHTPFQTDPRFIAHYKNSGKSNKANAYASLVEGIDKSLGDLMSHIKNLGIGENTLILFLGDNGSDAPLGDENGYTSAAPLRGKKATHWEGGMRVPFIASWVLPRNNTLQNSLPIAKNTLQQQTGTILDIFPTLIKWQNFDVPTQHVLDGFSLREQLRGKHEKKRHERFLNHYPHKHRSSYFSSLVDSNWKIVSHYNPDGNIRYALFDLEQDPQEGIDLAQKNKRKLRQMQRILDVELKDKNALLPQMITNKTAIK